MTQPRAWTTVGAVVLVTVAACGGGSGSPAAPSALPAASPAVVAPPVVAPPQRPTAHLARGTVAQGSPRCPGLLASPCWRFAFTPPTSGRLDARLLWGGFADPALAAPLHVLQLQLIDLTTNRAIGIGNVRATHEQPVSAQIVGGRRYEWRVMHVLSVRFRDASSQPFRVRWRQPAPSVR